MAVGFFDGVHLGHQAILRGASAALTFRSHPLSVLAPERAPRLIMTPEERVVAIRACGVEKVTVLDFTPELAALSPEDFIARHLSSLIPHPSSLIPHPSSPIPHPPSLICGANWRFGKGGAGDADFLRRRGIVVEVVPYAVYNGEPISSSRIRACLERGEIEDANAMMGRRYEVRGMRDEGKGLGRKLGFPTVNLKLETCNLKLPFGVYEVETDGLRGVANYGRAPTMGERAWESPVLEIHFPGAGSEDVRRKTSGLMTVSVVRFIRPERKFDSVAGLQRQIALDCAIIGT